MFPDTELGLSTISVMGGSVAGAYQLTTPRFGYSRVEMYFMGLATPAEVTPITFVQNGTTSQITIDEIIAANGARTPAYTAGQLRVFRVPTFVVKRQNETVSDSQLQQLQNLLFRWQSRFWRETNGRARANLTLDGSCSYTLSSTSLKTLSGGCDGQCERVRGTGFVVAASASDPGSASTSVVPAPANYSSPRTQARTHARERSPSPDSRSRRLLSIGAILPYRLHFCAERGGAGHPSHPWPVRAGNAARRQYRDFRGARWPRGDGHWAARAAHASASGLCGIGEGVHCGGREQPLAPDDIGGNALVRHAFEGHHLRERCPAAARTGFLASYHRQLERDDCGKDDGARGSVAVSHGARAHITMPRTLLPTPIDAPGVRKTAGREFEVGLERYAATAGDVWLFDRQSGVLASGDLVTLPAPFLDTACAPR